MNWVVFTNIYLLACAALGLAYGLYALYRRKMPMYYQLIVYAVCALVFSRLYYVVAVACYGGVPDIFNIGFIGEAAFLLFLFFANYGQIDMLVDDRKSLPLRYRVIPVILPAAELLISVFALQSSATDLSVRLSYCAVSILAGFAGYLNMKHLIVPDVEDGIVKTIRGFNLLAILTELALVAELGFSCFGLTHFILPTQIVSGLLYVAILPILSREVKKWIQ